MGRMRGQIQLLFSPIGLIVLIISALFFLGFLNTLNNMVMVLALGAIVVMAYVMGPKLANPKVFSSFAFLAIIILIAAFGWKMLTALNIQGFSIVATEPGKYLTGAQMAIIPSSSLFQLAAATPETSPFNPSGYFEQVDSAFSGEVVLAPRTYRPIDVSITNNDQLPLVVPKGSMLVAAMCPEDGGGPPICNLDVGDSVSPSQILHELVKGGKQVLNKYHVGVTVVDPSMWSKIREKAREGCGSVPIISDLCRAGATAGAELFAASFARFTKSDDVHNTICQDVLIWDRGMCYQLADDKSVCSKAVNPFERKRVFYVFADNDAPLGKKFKLKVYLLTPPNGLYGTISSEMACLPGFRQLSEVTGAGPGVGWRVVAKSEVPVEIRYPNVLLGLVVGAIGVILLFALVNIGRRMIR